MITRDVKYQLLTQEPGDDRGASSGTDEEQGTEHRRLQSSSKSPNLFERVFFCPSRCTLFLLVVAFVALYVFTTLEVSLVDNRRSWIPTSANSPAASDPKLISPLSNLMTQFRSSLNKWAQSQQGQPNSSENISALLPVRIQLNDLETFRLVEENSNLAAVYWEEWRRRKEIFTGHKKSGVKYCSNVKMISPYDVKQNNIYWQIAQTGDKNMTLYLLNAYYDNRLYGKPAVKLITTTDQQVEVEHREWRCLLWFNRLKVPVLSNVSEVYTVWPEYWGYGVKPGVYGPQIVTCDIPEQYATEVPRAISIQSTDNCEQMSAKPSNVVRVIHNQREAQSIASKRPSIGICVQAFRFRTYDVSVRLVEWLEFVKLLGADQVYFYVYGATPSMYKVLQHYRKEKFVNWHRITLPGEQVNEEALYNYYSEKLAGKFWPQELVELNDCLYKNLYRHDYIVIMDIDEIIMPQTADNWHELLESIRANLSETDLNSKGFYSNQHAYVYEMFEEEQKPATGEAMEEYLYTMRHTYRGQLLGPGVNIKCFHRTEVVSAVHNHFPMRCLNHTGHHSCPGLTVPSDKSILMHYRRDRHPPAKCPTPDQPIKCTVHDQTALRWHEPLAENVHKQLSTIFG